MPNILSRLTHAVQERGAHFTKAVQESRDRFTKAVSESRPVTVAKDYRDWWRERPGKKPRERRVPPAAQWPPPTQPRPQSPPSRPSSRPAATPSPPRTRVVFFGSRRPWRRLLNVPNPWLVIGLLAGLGYALVYRENPALGRYLAQQTAVLAMWVLQDIIHYPWLLLVVLGAWTIDHYLTGGLWIPRVILGLIVVGTFRVPSHILTLIPVLIFIVGWAIQDIRHHPWLLGILLIAIAIFALLNLWRVRGKLGFLTRSTTLYGLLLFFLNPTAPQGVILDRILLWPVWLILVWIGWRVFLLFKGLGFNLFPPFE